MTVLELLKGVVGSGITETQFMEDFSKLFRGGLRIPNAEAQCLSELVEDVNMAEHGGSLFDAGFVWRVEECLRLLSAGASASEIRSFFAKHRGP
jgi:fatty acid-binding protein DegV